MKSSAPSWSGTVVRGSVHGLKYPRFESSQGHVIMVAGLTLPRPGQGECGKQPINVFLSLFSPPPSTLSKKVTEKIFSRI